MKIIKEGRKQKGWAGEFTCTGYGNGNGGCGALLLVEESDIYTTSHYSYGDDFPSVFYTFSCNACNVETDIKNYTGPKESIPNKALWLVKKNL